MNESWTATVAWFEDVYGGKPDFCNPEDVTAFIPLFERTVEERLCNDVAAAIREGTARLCSAT